MKPMQVDDAALAFGGEMKKILPKFSELPEEFRKKWHSHPACNFVSRIFYDGGSFVGLVPKDGIEMRLAVRHITAILRSFEPKHEHKIAGCGWLISQWFTGYEG